MSHKQASDLKVTVHILFKKENKPKHDKVTPRNRKKVIRELVSGMA